MLELENELYWLKLTLTYWAQYIACRITNTNLKGKSIRYLYKESTTHSKPLVRDDTDYPN